MGEEFLQSLWYRSTRPDLLSVYLLLLVLAIVLIVVTFIGSERREYKEIVRDTSSSWFLPVLWVIATIISYVGYYTLGSDRYRDVSLSCLMLVTSFLFILWAVVTYFSDDLAAAFWLSLILLVYNVWYASYVSSMGTVAGLSMLPSIGLYILLVYYSVVDITINNVRV